MIEDKSECSICGRDWDNCFHDESVRMVKYTDAQAEIEEVVKVLEQETLANDTVVSELEAKNKELEELVNYYKSLLTSDKEIKERFKTLKK